MTKQEVLEMKQQYVSRLLDTRLEAFKQGGARQYQLLHDAMCAYEDLTWAIDQSRLVARERLLWPPNLPAEELDDKATLDLWYQWSYLDDVERRSYGDSQQ